MAEPAAAGSNETEEKWMRVRAAAIPYLSVRTEKHIELKRLRRARLLECLLYVGFTVVFSAVTITVRDNSVAFNHARGLREYLSGMPIPSIPSKEYEDITSVSEMWWWLREVLVGQVLWPIGSDQRYPILGNNQFFGPVRLRQVRVQESECKVPAVLESRGTSCFRPYSDDNSERRPNPPGTSWPEPDVCDQITPTFLDCHHWARYSQGDGWLPTDSALSVTYDDGGYMVDLPTSQRDAEALMAELQNYEWVNENYTRAVFVEFSLYNPNTNLFLSSLLTLEVPPSGGVIPLATFRVANLYPAGRSESAVGQALFYFLFGLVLIMFFAEAAILAKDFKAYFRDGYNLITFINLLFFFIVYIMDLNSLSKNSDLMSMAEADVGNHVHQYTYINRMVYNFNAFNAFLAWLRCLKYMDMLSNRTTKITATLHSCAPDVFALLIIFGIFYAGFSIAFYAAFGQDLHRFRTMAVTCLSLFDILMGGGDLEELMAYNRVLGPLLFVSFVILMVLVMLNMFLAIIVKTYAAVCDSLPKSHDSLPASVRWSVKRAANSVVKKISKKDAGPKNDSKFDEQELRVIWETDRDAFEVMGMVDVNDLLAISDTTGTNELEIEKIHNYEQDVDGDPAAGSAQEISHLLMKLLERTSSVMQEQRTLRTLVEGSRPASRSASRKGGPGVTPGKPVGKAL